MPVRLQEPKQLRKTFGDFSVFLSSWWKKQETPCLLPRLLKEELMFATMAALLIREETGTNIPALGLVTAGSPTGHSCGLFIMWHSSAGTNVFKASTLVVPKWCSAGATPDRLPKHPNPPVTVAITTLLIIAWYHHIAFVNWFSSTNPILRWTYKKVEITLPSIFFEPHALEEKRNWDSEVQPTSICFHTA